MSYSPFSLDKVRLLATLSVFILLPLNSASVYSQVPPSADPVLADIAASPEPDRIFADVATLAGFGTRNTLSDTTSETRGIGAARRWVKSEFDKISAACGQCLEVFYHRTLLKKEDSRRINEDVWIVNVIAIQRGTEHPNRYVMMSGDIDSRASSTSDGVSDAPGANDNASGMAGTLEAARVLTAYTFPSSIIYAGLSGEEQGLFGGKFFAQTAVDEGWKIEAVLNNDMIGNIEGIDGVIENNTFRIFSEAIPVGQTEQQHTRRRFYGGEVDGPSRQLARYIARITLDHFANLEPIMIYRLDRFGRGGHHRPFNDAGFPGVRIMETHENYTRQHQDIRTEDGIDYGDVLSGVNADYAAMLTGVNAVSLAALAKAPPPPDTVSIGGAVSPSTKLKWTPVEHKSLIGYKVYWRKTTESQWSRSRFVGDVTNYTLENVVIDNYLFGVAAVSSDGNESVVVFPSEIMR